MWDRVWDAFPGPFWGTECGTTDYTTVPALPLLAVTFRACGLC